jgi:hypothetical protein
LLHAAVSDSGKSRTYKLLAIGASIANFFNCPKHAGIFTCFA